MTNTEKPSTKAETKKQGRINPSKTQKAVNQALVKKKDKKIHEETKIKNKPKEVQNLKKIEEREKSVQSKPKTKKSEAVVNGKSLPISTKYSIAICKFINRKKISRAIAELEEVLNFKRAIPMKGEIPHRKGKGMMSGRYPKKAVEHFIKLLKSLQGNTDANEIDNPVIEKAVANFASRPLGRFGAWKRKRTHVKIIAKERKKVNKEVDKKIKEKKR